MGQIFYSQIRDPSFNTQTVVKHVHSVLYFNSTATGLGGSHGLQVSFTCGAGGGRLIRDFALILTLVTDS